MKKKLAYEVRRVIAILICSSVIVGSLSVETIAADDVTTENEITEDNSSLEDNHSSEESAEATESMPAQENGSVDESVPAKESAPAEESVPVLENVPAIESVPVEESTLADESMPNEENAQVEESLSSDNNAPFTENVAAEESTPYDASEFETAEEFLATIIFDSSSDVERELVTEDVEEKEFEATIEKVEETEQEAIPEDTEETETTIGNLVESEVETAIESFEDVQDNENLDGLNSGNQTLRSQEGRQGEYPDDEIDSFDGDDSEELKQWYLILNETTQAVVNKPETTVLEGKTDTLSYIIAGVTENLSSGIQSAITEIMSRSTDTPLAMIANSLIDADKYSVEYDGYDSKHCWNGAGSNSLWTSGWASYLGFTNEDEVMTYITKKFTDYGADQTVAWKWLFDGLYDNSYSAKMKESTSVPLATNIYIPAAIGKTIGALGNLSELNILEQLKDYSVAMEIGWKKDDEDVLANNTHAVTAMGVIFDSLATNVRDRYKAIILADPDDDEAGVQSTSAPASDDEAYQVKLNRPNKYNIYKLGTEIVNGVTYWTIKDYLPGAATYILSFDTLKHYSDELLNKITEKAGEGTTDFKNDYDFAIANAELQTFNGTEYESKDEFCGQPIELWINYNNYSYKAVKSNMTVPVEVEVTSKTTNKTIKKILNGVFTIDADAFGFGTIVVNLDELGLDPIGTEEYELTAIVNPIGKGGVREAYYVNNQAIKTTFKMTSSKGGFVEAGHDDEIYLHADKTENTNNTDTTSSAPVVASESVERFYATIDSILTYGNANYYAPNKTYAASIATSYDVYVKGDIENIEMVLVDGIQIPKELLAIVNNSHNVLKLSIPAGMMKGLAKGIHTIKLYLRNRIAPIEIQIEVI